MLILKTPAGYTNSSGKKVTDPAVLEYIKKLVIPPKYTDVKINYQKTGQPKILYMGYDSKKRLQRIYSATWTKKASRRKFCGLLNFAEQIQSISAAVKEQMGSERLTKKKCIAMIIRIVMVCYFRIGNRRYQELYGSFGAMNIQKKHVKFRAAKNAECMFLSFTGKKGVLNTCEIYDKQLISEMKKILKYREDDEMVFKWLNHGVAVPVRAIDVNAWLKSFDPLITSKDFRTYDANIFLIIFLRSQKSPTKLTQAARKKIVVAALKEISAKIHNTPAVLKKNYTQSGIINMYINEPHRFVRYFINDKTPRVEFIGYLRDYCKNFGEEKKEIVKEGGGGFKPRRRGAISRAARTMP
jgi:DNA topoisomerase-1